MSKEKDYKQSSNGLKSCIYYNYAKPDLTKLLCLTRNLYAFLFKKSFQMYCITHYIVSVALSHNRCRLVSYMAQDRFTSIITLHQKHMKLQFTTKEFSSSYLCSAF